MLNIFNRGNSDFFKRDILFVKGLNIFLVPDIYLTFAFDS